MLLQGSSVVGWLLVPSVAADEAGAGRCPGISEHDVPGRSTPAGPHGVESRPGEPRLDLGEPQAITLPTRGSRACPGTAENLALYSTVWN